MSIRMFWRSQGSNERRKKSEEGGGGYCLPALGQKEEHGRTHVWFSPRPAPRALQISFVLSGALLWGRLSSFPALPSLPPTKDQTNAICPALDL